MFVGLWSARKAKEGDEAAGDTFHPQPRPQPEAVTDGAISPSSASNREQWGKGIWPSIPVQISRAPCPRLSAPPPALTTPFPAEWRSRLLRRYPGPAPLPAPSRGAVHSSALPGNCPFQRPPGELSIPARSRATSSALPGSCPFQRAPGELSIPAPTRGAVHSSALQRHFQRAPGELSIPARSRRTVHSSALPGSCPFQRAPGELSIPARSRGTVHSSTLPGRCSFQRHFQGAVHSSTFSSPISLSPAPLSPSPFPHATMPRCCSPESAEPLGSPRVLISKRAPVAMHFTPFSFQVAVYLTPA
ncbi:putative proline-rich protein 21 isoform X1 [Mauremys mutica]|uniref:putative proline-rich protein 21 isoform X1 n=1 Tax=Mauremys mutica TaxID=74926 RepID=UPI001D16BF8E|nr:putative proline-rich protein 21 isoform X1 [Mauremys mutica]